MNILAQRLWKLDAETGWTTDELQAPDGARQRFQRFLLDVLGEVVRSVPDVSHAYIAITGFECGRFQPVASFNRPLADIVSTATAGDNTLVGQYIRHSHPMVHVRNPSSHPLYRGDPSINEKLFVKLIAHGEFYGFMSLDAQKPGAFPVYFQEIIDDALPVLSRIIADAVFTMRLRQLTSQFHLPMSEHDPSTMCHEIAARTVAGFGADGAVLRLYDPIAETLAVKGLCGDVPAALLENQAPGHGHAGSVFSDKSHTWAIGSNDAHERAGYLGAQVPPADDALIRETGIFSYIIMRLVPEEPVETVPSALGTLSFFHRRPHRFSWRDIALFKSFCQRVADTLSLHTKSINLADIAENLRLQSLVVTRVEVVALLAHDLAHKALDACIHVSDYVDACRKALNNKRERRSHDHLEPLAQEAITSAQLISKSLGQIKSLQNADAESRDKPTDFDLGDVVKELEALMTGALKRNRLTIEYVPAGTVRVFGQKSILIQAFLTLIINSIEASRTSRKQRQNTIHIRAHAEQQGDSRKIVIHFSDEGPGINRLVFADPNQIFEIGKTTKPTGTGTGLPVARSLIGRYFNGQLVLEDPEKAQFRITIPQPAGAR